MMNPEMDMVLPLTLAMKLGSIVVHADELTTPSEASPEDAAVIKSLLQDKEVTAWIKTMGTLLPLKRGTRQT